MFIILQKAINEPGKNYAHEADTLDLKINKYDIEIEQQATILIATRQPLAIDLRQITSAIKIAVIMERMGDLSKNITRRVSSITEVIHGDVLEDINTMTGILIVMLDNILVSIKNMDVNNALTVIEKDAHVDSLYIALMGKLSGVILKNQKMTQSMMQLVIAIKNIERIGDYITKVAKILYYIVTGDTITTKAS